MSVRDHVERYVARNPDATVAEVLGHLESAGFDALEHRDTVADVFGDEGVTSSEENGHEKVSGSDHKDSDTPEGGASGSDAGGDCGARSFDSMGNPAICPSDAGTFPADWQDIDQWMVWKPTDDGRKVPRAPHRNPGRRDAFASWKDPETWMDFRTAKHHADWDGYGVAFVIQNADREDHDADPFVLVDYDDARDPGTGRVHPTVREHIERADSYADISTSGTGVHILARGELPEGVKAIEADLPATEGFPDAEIEVYDTGRFIAMTGEKINGTPDHTTDCQAFIEDLADEYATVAEGTPDELTREPEKEREEIADVETTTDMQDVLDAIQHVKPRDIYLRSTVTHERGDGSKSLDPSWAGSESGTRLAQVGDGWVYRKGMHGLDALQVVALEERIVHSEGEYPTGEDFWKAVEALRERGAHIPEFEGSGKADSEPMAVLPESEQTRATADGWDWTTDNRANEEDLTIDDARDRTQNAIADAFEHADQVLVDALPSMGKSYGSVAAAANTDQPVTILTGRGRKEQYDQYKEWADEHGLDTYTLPSFPEHCPVAAGEHGEDLRNLVMDWYSRGATPKMIHKTAEYVRGEPLPCQHHEGGCPYASRWNFDPDEHDVILGHYSHAHKRKVTAGRSLVFDEFPGGAYETELDSLLATAVTHYCESTDAFPFEDFADLMEHRDDRERRNEALEHFENADLEPSEDQVFDGDHTHAYAPLATYTLLTAEDLGNGWGRADLGDGRVGLVDRGNVRVLIRNPPPFDVVRNVVALDGTPTREMWETALGTRLNHRQVLTDDERAEYLTDALGHQYVRTTEYVKPYNSADHVSVDSDGALLEAIADEHGETPVIVTTAAAEQQYELAGLLGGSDALASESKHYGNVLGSNEYKTERLGAVIGSNHYGDGFIKKWGAYAGEAVERDGDGKGAELSYTGIGDRILTHMREHDTLQAAMRFGRDGNGAVVYVHTDTLPEWVPVAGEGRVLQTWSDGMREVIDALDDIGAATTAEIASHSAVDIGERQVRDHLATLAEEHGVVDRETEGCGYVWRDDGLHRVNEHGDAELDPVDLEALDADESAELARTTIYTWDFRTCDDDGGSEAGSTPASDGAAMIGPDDGGGRAGNGVD